MNEKIVYSDIFKTAWKGLIAQIWLLAGLLIGFTIIYSLLLLFAFPLRGEAMSISGFLVLFVSMLFGGLFIMGYLRNCLQSLDGEEPQFSAYGQVAGKLINFLLACIFFTVITTIGFALFVFPGVYLFLRFQFFFASMIDEDTGLITSFKRSWTITKGHTTQLFVLMLICLLLFFIGMIAVFIGVFVAIPLISLLYGYTFRKLVAPDVQ